MFDFKVDDIILIDFYSIYTEGYASNPRRSKVLTSPYKREGKLLFDFVILSTMLSYNMRVYDMSESILIARKII